jgi:hypothetical protein
VKGDGKGAFGRAPAPAGLAEGRGRSADPSPSYPPASTTPAGLLLPMLEPEELHLLCAPSFRPPVPSSAARGCGRRDCAAGSRRPPADLRRAAGMCPELLSVRGGVNVVDRVAFSLLLPRGWRGILEGCRRSRVGELQFLTPWVRKCSFLPFGRALPKRLPEPRRSPAKRTLSGDL